MKRLDDINTLLAERSEAAYDNAEKLERKVLTPDEESRSIHPRL